MKCEYCNKEFPKNDPVKIEADPDYGPVWLACQQYAQNLPDKSLPPGERAKGDYG